MRKIGKIGLRVLALAAALLASGPAYASHGMGGTLTYQYVGATTGVANQYRITLTLVREVTGAGNGASQTVNVESLSCGFSQTVTLTASQSEFSDTTTRLYQCVPISATPGTPKMNVFQGLVVMPQNCPDVKISWTQCCRPVFLTGLAGAASQSAYLEAELNTEVPNTVNSAVRFTGPSTVFVCSGSTAVIPQHGVESDGDSVRYELVPGRQDYVNGRYRVLTYGGTRTFLQPLTTMPNTQMLFDQRTGEITLPAFGSMASVVVIRASDYRWIPSRNRWVKMGSSLREVVIGVSTQCVSGPASAPVSIKPAQPGWTSIPPSVPIKLLPCGDTSLTFLAGEQLSCGSVSASDFRLFSNQGALLPIKRAEVLCSGSTGSTGNQVRLVFHGMLAGGAYYLISGLFDATPAGFVCDQSAQDTIGVIQVVNCPSPAEIACPGTPVCPTSVSVSGPHTFYSTWSDPSLVGVPPHTSTWTLTGGYLATPAVGDTVQAFITGTSATLVLETRFGLCVEHDTLLVASTVDLAEAQLPQLELRPNPAEGAVAVSGIPPGAVLEVVNLLGQCVLRSDPVTGGSAQMDVSHLARGTYWVVATSPTARIQTPLVKL